ncbi:restriction endonuclease [Allobranchiibius sp. GilTou38]|uniref:restriction endonuclease n=1 Tax=Allobranchiibius sp. GilTou38 TaxID=2815210 RepID=UPI001AA1B5E1|nr:restriction endonuclease [Allobranchiibius sp. GilTou38]MBO1768238.1 restriction endonuclease [Allobranchiibius sp. GilTou38]
MSLVEWTALPGETTEAVVAMLVNREYPTSTRITPSQGDGGVDILLRDGDGPGRDVVYQVKRYTKVESKEKTSISDSLTTLFADPRWSQLNVTQWRLVLPWDPTPEQDQWLQGLMAKFEGVTAVWHGRTFVDQLAAKHSDVIDYWLHGGRERRGAEMAQLASLLGLSNVESTTTPAELVDRLGRAVGALQDDPLYEFVFHTGEGSAEEVLHKLMVDRSDQPGLAMSCVQGAGENRWVQVDIVARCAASTQIAPIIGTGHMSAPVGTAAAQELENFNKFGAPLVSGEVKFDGTLDAPGGFGGPIENATLHLLPVSLPTDEDHDLRMEVRTPEGEAIAQLDLTRTDRSHGSSGMRVVLTEENALVTIGITADLVETTTHISLTLGQLVGRPVSSVEPIFRFLSACHAPNTVHLGRRHAWPATAVHDPLFSKLFDQPGVPLHDWQLVAGAMKALAAIQASASEVIKTPDFTTVTNGEIGAWSQVEQLLSGQELEGTYPEDLVVRLNVSEPVAASIADEGLLTDTQPLKVRVKDQELDLGRELHTRFEHARVVASWATEEAMTIEVQTEDRQFRLHVGGFPVCQCSEAPDSDMG